jgi:DNA-binding response OmpR family regulator/putative methionine-R-sulfoxide reductase with GAF domain
MVSRAYPLPARARRRVTCSGPDVILYAVPSLDRADTHRWVEREPVELATGTIDFARSRFVRSDGGVERLTTREAEVLAYLVDRADEPVARDDLLGAVWGHHHESLSRAVDAAMSRLRRKLDPDPDDPRVLFTVHGHGYRLLTRTAPPITVPIDPAPSHRVLRLRDRVVDLGAGFVEGPEGRTLLTARERLMLEQLLRAGGQIVEAGKLARSVGVIGGKSALSNAVSRLRAKLEADPGNPHTLLSIRGEGYRLDAPTPEAPPTKREDHDRALRSLARHVGLVFGLHDCVVYRREGDELRQVAAHGPKHGDGGEVRSPLVLRLGEGLVGHAAAECRPVRVDQVAHDDRYVLDLEPAASELCVPIVSRGRVVGVLDSESTRPGSYDERLVQAFMMLAAIAAPAFDTVSDP